MADQASKKRKLALRKDEVTEKKKILCELYKEDSSRFKFEVLEKVGDNFRKIFIKDVETKQFILENDIVLCEHNICKTKGFSEQVR